MKWLRITWAWIRNDPLVLDDGDVWKLSRRDYFNMVRPMWTYTLFVKRYECGCRYRFGWKRWPVTYCMRHAFGEDANEH